MTTSTTDHLPGRRISSSAYRSGCRCAGCTAASTAAGAAYRERVRKRSAGALDRCPLGTPAERERARLALAAAALRVSDRPAADLARALDVLGVGSSDVARRVK